MTDAASDVEVATPVTVAVLRLDGETIPVTMDTSTNRGKFEAEVFGKDVSHSELSGLKDRVHSLIMATKRSRKTALNHPVDVLVDHGGPPKPGRRGSMSGAHVHRNARFRGVHGTSGGWIMTIGSEKLTYGKDKYSSPDVGMFRPGTLDVAKSAEVVEEVNAARQRLLEAEDALKALFKGAAVTETYFTNYGGIEGAMEKQDAILAKLLPAVEEEG